MVQNNKFHRDGQHPIHPELECIKGQLLSLVVAFYVRHKLTKTALQDLLSLLNVAVPECVPRSKYLVERYFFCPGASNTQVHYVCPNCQSYITEPEDAKGSLTCSSCDGCEELDTAKLLETGDFFLFNPIKEQLIDFLQTGDLATLLFERRRHVTPGYKGDIRTGDCYQ